MAEAELEETMAGVAGPVPVRNYRDPDFVRINRLYSRQFDFPLRVDPPSLRYMIATMPRSGSTLFSLSLWRTGSLGAPMEYLNLPNHETNIKSLGKGNLEEYWRQIVARRTSPNGVFGFKAFVTNLRQAADASPELLAHTGVDKVIFLTRRDRAAHAVSYARAIKTKSWFYGTNEQQAWEYDFSAINRAERWLVAQERSWEKLFRQLGVVPFRVVYEDFLEEKGATVNKILDWLNVPLVPSLFHVPLLKKQSGDNSRAWVDRYVAEKASRKARRPTDNIRTGGE